MASLAPSTVFAMERLSPDCACDRSNDNCNGPGSPQLVRIPILRDASATQRTAREDQNCRICLVLLTTRRTLRHATQKGQQQTRRGQRPLGLLRFRPALPISRVFQGLSQWQTRCHLLQNRRVWSAQLRSHL